MTLKIAVLAAMPRPSVRMKASENPGARQSAQREANIADHCGSSGQSVPDHRASFIFVAGRR
jgi:hypothetical protein